MKHLLILILSLSTSFLFAQKTKKTPQGEEYYFKEDVKGTNAIEGDYVYYTRQDYDQKGKLVDQIFDKEEFVEQNSFLTLVSVGDKMVKSECISAAVSSDESGADEYCYNVLFTIQKVVPKKEIENIIQTSIDQNEQEITTFLKAYKPEDIRFYEEGACYAVVTKIGIGEKPAYGSFVSFEFEDMKTGEITSQERMISGKAKYAFLADMRKGEEAILLMSFKHLPNNIRNWLFLKKDNIPSKMKVRILEINTKAPVEEDYYNVEEAAVAEEAPIETESSLEYEESTIETEEMK